MIYVKFLKQVKGFAYGQGAEAFVADSPKLQAAIKAGLVVVVVNYDEYKPDLEETKKQGRKPKTKMNVHTR